MSADEPMYNPVDKPRRGRPPKQNPESETPLSAATTLPVSEAVSADVSLSTEQKAGETIEEAVARIRGLRRPFGAMTLKLALDKRVGYHRHWFNDVPGRIDEALTSGWTHVTKDGKPLSRVVGTGRDNGVLRAFAMEIPLVFWEEDMAARHQAAQDKIDDIKKKPFQSRPGEAKIGDQGKFYSPTNAEPLTVVQPK